MNIGLLLCEDVHPDLSQQYGNYPEMFSALLKKAKPSH